MDPDVGRPMPPANKRNNLRTLESSTAIITFSGGASQECSDDSSESEEETVEAAPQPKTHGKSPTISATQQETNKNEKAVNNNQEQVQNGLPDEPSILINQVIDSTDTCQTSTFREEPSSRTPRSQRINPFNNDIHVEEDHFSHSVMDTTQDRSPETPYLDDSSDLTSSKSSPLKNEFARDNQVTNAELGLAENHFSQPEGPFGLSTIEELEMAINNCKHFIMEAPPSSDRRKNLVNKLIQFRLQLQEVKEGPTEPDSDVKIVVGHRFMKRDSNSSKHYCEKCTSVIWGVFQTWYKCTECGFCCHDKCLNLIYRTCASVKATENPHYILSICPTKGISSQNYRCAECRTPISYLNGYKEPRQCDYTGAFYCRACHWNDTMVVPSRVLHNWDLEPRKVCRASKQFLRLMSHRACLRIQDINPMLFSFVEELNEVKKLREEILIMKKYFLSCQDALNSKLLLQLLYRQHFVDNSDMYSLEDLLDVAYDRLLPELAKIHSSFAQHIKTDCQRCQAKGYMCELCDMQEVLFPFDNIAIVCDRCSTVLHRHCFLRRNRICPKCERLSRRAAVETTPEGERVAT